MKLIEEWKKSYTLLSIQVFFIIGLAPDFYNAVAAMGWLDQAPLAFTWTIRILAMIGLLSRLIKQNKKEAETLIEKNKEVINESNNNN